MVEGVEVMSDRMMIKTLNVDGYGAALVRLDPDPAERHRVDEIKEVGAGLINLIHDTANGREAEIAIQRIEEGIMWIVKTAVHDNISS